MTLEVYCDLQLFLLSILPLIHKLLHQVIRLASFCVCLLLVWSCFGYGDHPVIVAGEPVANNIRTRCSSEKEPLFVLSSSSWARRRTPKKFPLRSWTQEKEWWSKTIMSMRILRFLTYFSDSLGGDATSLSGRMCMTVELYRTADNSSQFYECAPLAREEVRCFLFFMPTNWSTVFNLFVLD